MKQAFLIILFFISLSIIGQIPTNGLVGAWPFSGNASDVSGSANHGTVIGAALVPDRCGVPNSAYSFNGTSDCIVMLTAGPTGTLSRSLSFWAKTTNTVINSPRASFDYGGSTGAGDFWEVVWNYCSAGVGLDIGNQALIRGNNCLENNVWHHIAIVFDATVSTVYSTTNYYIDGVLQTVISCNVSGTTATLSTGTAPITIAKNCSSNARFWPGQLDDFYLYNRALTSTEVLQLYNYTTCPIPVTGNTMVCPGSTNIYSVPAISNATYTWTLPGGWTGTSATNTIAVVAGTGPGTITAAASSTCGSFGTSTLAVNTLTPPLLNVSSTHPTLCIGGTTTLSVTGALTYSWLPTVSNATAITVAPSVATVYTLSGTGSNSCISKFIFTQYVATTATVTATALPPPCNGATVAMIANGATSYTWQPVNLTGSMVVVSPTISSSYTVFGLSTSGCTGTAIIFVSVPSALTLNIALSSPTACPGNSITLTANASGGTSGYLYNWIGGPASAAFVIGHTTAGTYPSTVTATDANTCTITRTTSVVFVPNFTLSSYSMAICPGSVATLTITGASTYTWDPGNNTGSTYTDTPTGMATYTVTGTSSLGCIASAIETVTIKPAPTISFNTFSITCGSLGSATVMASGTPGPFTYSWVPTLQTSSAATGLFPGTYTVSVYDAGTGCAFSPTTNFAPLIPLTGTVSATNSLTCNGINTATAGISLAGGSASQSYAWMDLNGTLTTHTVNTLAAGVNTITVTDLLTFCSVTHTFLVTQPGAFTLNITASSPSVCMGGAITYTALNSGGTPGYSYTWTNGSPNTNTFLANETTPAVYIYTVISTDAHNCVATRTINGKFVSNPVVSALDASVCPFALAGLTAAGATSYSWSNGSTANPLFVNVGSNTHYTVTGNTAGCTASAIVGVLIKPVPTATFTSNAPVCQGDSLFLTSLNTQSLYSWSGPQNFGATTGAVSIHTVLPSASGLYTLKVTAVNSCTASITKSLTVNPSPVLSASGNTVCQGQNLNFFATFMAGASYVWSGPAYSSTVQNAVRPFSDPAMSGNYTVIITSAVGCTNTAIAGASVIPTPTAIITASSDYCVGSPIFLNGGGGNTYIWAGPGGFISSLQNPTVNNANLSAAGNYSLFAYIGSCLGVAVKSISVNPLPVITITNNSPVCANTTIGFSVTGAALTYTWFGPGGFTSNSQDLFIYSASQLVHAGIYTLHVTDANTCKGSAYSNVSVLPAPVASAGDATTCLGSPVTLTASGGVSYIWTGPQNFSSLSALVYFPTTTTLQAGVYTVAAVGPNACQSTATLMLNILSLPLPVPVISGEPKACLNSTLSLQGSGGVSYSWAGPAKFTATTQTIKLPVTGNNISGIYSLSVKSESNCVASATLAVNVVPQPQGTLTSSNNDLCVPFCTNLELKTPSGDSSLVSAEFKIDEEIIKQQIKTYCFYEGRNYLARVNFMDTNNCSNTSTLMIVVHPKPEADFDYRPLDPLAGIDEVKFYNTSRGEGLGSWNWFISGTDSTWQDKDIAYFTERAGKFPVVLIAKNKWGCLDTTIKILVVNDEFNLYVPNAFSPNGDGLNDIFQPKGQGIFKYTMEIYDRWGAKIFETNDFYTGWDGMYRGKECKSDAYVWKIVATSQQKETKQFAGRLMLMRAAVKEPE